MGAINSKSQSTVPGAVVAMDIGTSYTGIACSYHHDKYENNQSTSYVKLPKDREPTTVLFNPDKSFNSFGYEAEKQYAKLSDKKEHTKYFYFKWFKMALYSTGTFTRDVTINDIEGRPMNALFVFQTVIKHLRNYAKSVIEESYDQISENDILWILTIPADCSDAAKPFLREAAIQAGIAKDQLKLVLEPETASFFCKELPNMTTADLGQSYTSGKIKEGHAYMVANLGGGSAAIFVHVMADGNLLEIYRATAESFGATCVDMAFQQLFIELIGVKSWTDFKDNYMDEYLEFMKSFERRKTIFSSLTKEEERFTIPAGLLKTVKDNLKQNFGEIISETKYAGSISEYRNKLSVNYKVMEGFFKATVQGVVELLKQCLYEMRTEDIQTLLMVGGFSESPYLREVIESEISGLQIIFPPDGSSAVLKGAIMMRYRPGTIIKKRPWTIMKKKARFSYGVAVINPFQEGVDPECLRVVNNGEVWCNLVFQKLITKGEIVRRGQVIKWFNYNTFKTQKSKHKTYYTTLYKSTESDPHHCTEEQGCTVVGRLEQMPPQEGWPVRVEEELHLIVGDAEITLKMFNETIGTIYEAKMEFL